MEIQINHIQARTYVDGPGERTALFVQGCTLACPGCQNRALWPQTGGQVVDTADLANTLSLLATNHGNVTISGGEPFQQAKSLAYLVRDLRTRGIGNIILYTGFTWEALRMPNPAMLWISEVLSRINVLVDGPFVAGADDPFITWRGSRNQRPIDVPASLRAGYPVVLDWSQPEIVITTDGDALMPIGIADNFASLGAPRITRRCGETGRAA